MKSDLKHILYILEIALGTIIHMRSDYTRIHLSIFCFGLVFAVARYCAGLSAIDKVFDVLLTMEIGVLTNTSCNSIPLDRQTTPFQ